MLLHKYVIGVWYTAAMYMLCVVELFASTHIHTQTHSENNQIKTRKQTEQSQNHKLVSNTCHIKLGAKGSAGHI